jgi:hypothetical protein
MSLWFNKLASDTRTSKGENIIVSSLGKEGLTGKVIIRSSKILLFCEIKLKPTHVASIVIRGCFVEQKLVLSSSFRCDQIYKCQAYDFGHTLLCCLN